MNPGAGSAIEPNARATDGHEGPVPRTRRRGWHLETECHRVRILHILPANDTYGATTVRAAAFAGQVEP
jgi:hypothetical protein